MRYGIQCIIFIIYYVCVICYVREELELCNLESGDLKSHIITILQLPGIVFRMS